MFANMRGGGVRQGGSTITQQLAKTNFLSGDRTIKRKAQEVIIAFWLEAWLTKQEILSRYLSSVYFGDGVYGLRAAAHHYFGREPGNLTLAQSAMLAGMVQAPSRLAPTQHLAAAQKRSRLVLAAMADTGAISRGAGGVGALRRGRWGRRRRSRPAPISPTGSRLTRSQAFEADFGEVRVRTTLDRDLQRLAVRAVSRAAIGDAQAALVAMRPDGRVVAMVGGRSYKDSPFNRATQARRQPGSAFKLFVYLAALRAGWTPDSMIEDEPITIDGWTPVNSDRVYRGEISLREAFARSSNAATVRLSQKSRPRQCHPRRARSRHFDPAAGQAEPRAGHGGGQPARADLGLCRGRRRALPDRRARPRRGAAARGPGGLVPRAPACSIRAATARRCSTCSTRRRTAAPAAAPRSPSRPSARPAPRQDNRDALFVGFAGDLVVGVWVGRDDNKSLGKISRRHGPGGDLAQFHGLGAGDRPSRRPAAAERIPFAPAPARPLPRKPAARGLERRHQGPARSSRRSRDLFGER